MGPRQGIIDKLIPIREKSIPKQESDRTKVLKYLKFEGIHAWHAVGFSTPKERLMKTLIALVVAFLFVFTDSKASKPEDDNLIGNGKNKSLFVVRAKKKFVGATVEVYSSQGKLVTTQNLYKRKMIIDFADVKKDTYTIRMVKGGATKEFHFVKI